MGALPESFSALAATNPSILKLRQRSPCITVLAERWPRGGSKYDRCWASAETGVSGSVSGSKKGPWNRWPANRGK